MPNHPTASRPRWTRLLTALILLAFLLPVSPAHGNSNRKGEWRSYETNSFTILFHEGVEAQAAFARDFLEPALRDMRARLKLPYRGARITVVLTGHVDDPNGFASPVGHRIVIWTRPAQVLAASDLAWLRRVLAHELAHQVTFLALRNYFGIYGELYKTSNLPAWFMEGLAQYLAEAWDAKRATFFAHAVHNSALEAYPALASFTRQDPVAGRLVYEQGHALVRYLADRNGGPEFLGQLLRKVTCVPVYTEVKALLSPLTKNSLPLESALRSLTGKSMSQHYRDFLAEVEGGRAPGGPVAGRALVPGAEGLDLIHWARRVGPGDWVVAAQARWDEPYTALYRLREGRVDPLGTGLVNPVFDLSGDGRRIAFVREYTDVDGEPVQRLFLRHLASGTETAVSDGAYHPAFLGGDTLAFSRWRGGRQDLVVCAKGAFGCRAEAPDSLVGFYALSRSRRGILMNAAEASGAAGIWEYLPGSGFHRIFQDTVTCEFPVEAEDGKLFVLRSHEGLMRPATLDPATGAVETLPGFPAGAFLLHRAAPGPGGVAAVAQVNPAPHAALAPVALPVPPAPTAASGTDTARAALGDTASRGASAADRADTAFAGRRAEDSTADSTAPSTAAPASTTPSATTPPAADGYRVPAFLRAPPLLPDSFPVPPPPASAQGYHSLLGIRPLLAWPYLTPGFREVAAGLGVLLEDPLSLHSLTLNAGVGGEDSPLYDVAYTNAQTPVRISLWAANTHYNIDSIGQDRDSSGSGADRTLYAIRHWTSAELSLSMRMPWPLPRLHALFLAAAVGGEYRQDRVGAAGKRSGEYLDRDINQEWTYHHRIGAGYAYALPYAYAAAHPLRETAFGMGIAEQYPDLNRYVYWEALNTFPLYQELTLTLFHSGQWNHASRFRDERWELPNGERKYFYYLRERGMAWNVHAGMDLPLWKGWLAEFPLLGVCNFVGVGAYGAYGRQNFEPSPHSPGPGYDSTGSVGGGRIFALFHVMRKIPLVLSLYAEQDFEAGGQHFGVSTEVGALPSRVTGITAALDRMLPRPSRRAAGLEDRLRRVSPLP